MAGKFLEPFNGAINGAKFSQPRLCGSELHLKNLMVQWSLCSWLRHNFDLIDIEQCLFL